MECFHLVLSCSSPKWHCLTCKRWAPILYCIESCAHATCNVQCEISPMFHEIAYVLVGNHVHSLFSSSIEKHVVCCKRGLKFSLHANKFLEREIALYNF